MESYKGRLATKVNLSRDVVGNAFCPLCEIYAEHERRLLFEYFFLHFNEAEDDALDQVSVLVKIYTVCSTIYSQCYDNKIFKEQSRSV